MNGGGEELGGEERGKLQLGCKNNKINTKKYKKINSNSTYYQGIIRN